VAPAISASKSLDRLDLSVGARFVSVAMASDMIVIYSLATDKKPGTVATPVSVLVISLKDIKVCVMAKFWIFDSRGVKNADHPDFVEYLLMREEIPLSALRCGDFMSVWEDVRGRGRNGLRIREGGSGKSRQNGVVQHGED